MKTLTAIVAMTSDRVIGRDGTLPWHLPEDLKFFKRTTIGRPVVMGRSTFDSIGRPLPKRRNIVLTRDPGWSSHGAEAIHQPDALSRLDLDGEIFIIGGAQIYQAFLASLDQLLVSKIIEPHPGDTYFPPFEHLFHPPEHVETHPGFEVLKYRSI